MLLRAGCDTMDKVCVFLIEKLVVQELIVLVST
jgi:hypothetical protein